MAAAGAYKRYNPRALSGVIMQDLAEFATANPWLVSGLIASGLAVLFYELRQKARDIGSLNTAMAVRLINDGSKVVDVRAADRFAAGHILDAENIPEKDLLDNPDKLKNRKKNTLLVCDTGNRSAEAAAALRKAGLETVFSLKGGLAAWQQENLPVVRDSGN
jgi:rhodanese-related sulfurtransferase